MRLINLRGIKAPKIKATTGTDITPLRPVEFYNVPLKLKNVSESEPVVRVGDSVKQGTLIAKPVGNFGLNIYSPVSGKILNIFSKMNAGGEYCKHILVMNDNKDEVEDLPQIDSISDVTLISRLRDAGIIDTVSQMPSYLKYAYVGARSYKTLIVLMDSTDPNNSINQTLAEYKMEEVVNGAKYFMNITNAQFITFVFTENNYKLAAKLKKHIAESKKRYDFKIKFIPNKYPFDNPYILASLVCKKKINKNLSFLDAGITIENAETCYNFCRAVEFNKPVTNKVVTVDGDNVTRKGNYFVPNGASYQNILEFVGVEDIKAPSRLIDGSIMSGNAQFNEDISISFMTNTILVLKFDELTDSKEYPCISCGKCSSVCPVFLNPQAIERTYLSEEIEDFNRLRGHSCIDCGCCSYVCPARRHLSQRISAGKFYFKKDKGER